MYDQELAKVCQSVVSFFENKKEIFTLMFSPWTIDEINKNSLFLLHAEEELEVYISEIKDEYEKDIKSLEGGNDEFRKEIKALQDLISEKDHEIKVLTKTNEDLEYDLKMLTKEKSDLEDTVEELQNKL